MSFAYFVSRLTSAAKVNYDKLCSKIFEVDRNIRFAGVIDKMGRLLAGGMRPGIEPMEPRMDSQKLYLDFAFRTAMRHDFDSTFGRVIYTLSEREKIKFVSVPLTEYLVLVTIEKGAPHEAVLKTILKLTKKM